MRKVALATFFWQSQPMTDTLHMLDALGVDMVELDANAPETSVDFSDSAAVDQLRKVAGELPITVHSIHSGFSSPSPEYWDLSQPDRDGRRRAIDRHRDVIHAAAKLGAQHVLIHPGTESKGDDRIDMCRDSIAQLLVTAREQGIRIAIENNPPGYLICSIAEMRQLLAGKELDSAGVCVDTGHALLGDDGPAEYVRAFGDRLIAVHWHDNDGSEDQHVFPGSGETDWSGFIAALNEVCYDQPVIVEAYPKSGNSLREAIRETERRLKVKG